MGAVSDDRKRSWVMTTRIHIDAWLLDPVSLQASATMPEMIRPAPRARDQGQDPYDAAAERWSLPPVDGRTEVYLVGAGTTSMARDA